MEDLLERWQRELRECASEAKAGDLARFFKTGQGEYGEGDVFAGIVVPDCRKVSAAYADAPFEVIGEMLSHEVHICFGTLIKKHMAYIGILI